LDRNLLCVLGAIHRLGPDRRMADRLPPALESNVRHLEWLNRRSYSVYIIHPVVLVGISLLLRPWAAPALIKLAVTGTPRVRNLLDASGSARPGPWPAADCLALGSRVR
jgi:hypothetical protein